MRIFDTHLRVVPSSTCGRGLALGILISLVLVAFASVPISAAAQQTFQVTSLDDLSDTNPGDGVCDTGGIPTLPSGCTLRAAIEEANADVDADRIEFTNIRTTGGVAVIFATDELEITEALEIDGRTAPGYSLPGPPVVYVNGVNLTDSVDDGLQIFAGASETRIDALGIINFPDDGIDITDVSDVEVFHCYIGVDFDGVTPAGNADHGINLFNASNITIGLEILTQGRNVISGNGETGIRISFSDANRVGNNFIGVTADGTQALGNGGDGIAVANGTANQIGDVNGSIPLGNVISGNGGSGVGLFSSGNTLLGNRIGVSVNGLTAIPNTVGMRIEGNDNTVGPDSDGAGRNIISGNEEDGIVVGLEGGGPLQVSSDNNTIQYNYIGTDRNGGSPLGNGQSITGAGIRLERGLANVMAANVIGSNSGSGVVIGPGDRAFGNQVRSSYIGTNRDGADLGNGAHGIRIAGGPPSGSPNFIGGLNDGDANVIGLNGENGIVFSSLGGVAVQNFIGTNPSGDYLGNAAAGVLVSGANDIQIGFNNGAGNTIGLNLEGGIVIENSTDVLVLGNYIGTNEIGSGLANGLNGVSISGGGPNAGIIVGSSYTVPIDPDPSPNSGEIGNRIAFNTRDGISVSGSLTGVAIRGNLVYNNGFLGIDLGADGLTPNDAGDGDSGTNNLQNTPEIDRAQTTYNEATGQVEVRYRVRCNTTDCNYGTSGLRVDFYLADLEESGQGRTYVHTDAYPSSVATSYRLISFAPPSGVTVSRSDFIVATATDADNNTSEFSPPPAPQLPVELAGLAAQSTGNTVVLTWKTLSEQGNDRFEIEQKAPGASGFRSVGTVDGAGTTTETTDYRFVTEELLAGTHTFRLRQVDVDGTDELSRTVTARVQIAEAIVLSAPSPNPVRNQLSVRVGVQESQTVRVVLYDLLGRAVATLHEGALPGGEERTLRATLPTLPSGKYFLRLEGETGQTVQPVTVIR